MSGSQVRDLSGGAHHLAYEWSSTVDMAALLQTVKGSRSAEHNAYLEAGLVHYRCVVNFLCGNYKGTWKPDEMRPADFLGEPWYLPDVELDRRMRGRLPDVNQNLAHLSWDRLSESAFVWPFGLLAHEAHYALGLFLAAVPMTVPWRMTLDAAQQGSAQRLPPPGPWPSTPVQPAPPRRIISP